jgi:hypothetical protein
MVAIVVPAPDSSMDFLFLAAMFSGIRTVMKKLLSVIVNPLIEIKSMLKLSGSSGLN